MGSRGSGTLIAPNWIITAAHVVDHLQPAHYESVDVGNGSEHRSDPLAFGIDAVFIHPDWAGDTGNDVDLALVRLVSPVTIEPMNRHGGTVSALLEQTVTIVGYGNTGNGRDGVELLSDNKRAGTNTIDARGAALDYNNFILLADFDGVGAADQNRWGDESPTSLEALAALGDSGGSWVVSGRLAGVTSFGGTSAGSSYVEYGAYDGAASIQTHRNWINETMAGVNWNSRNRDEPFENSAAWGDSRVPDSTQGIRFSVPRVGTNIPEVDLHQTVTVRAITVEFGPQEIDARTFALRATAPITIDHEGEAIFSRGTLSALDDDGRMRIGQVATGKFTQQGGTVLLAGNLTLGQNFGASGIYQLNAGELIMYDESVVEVGRSGSGQLIQTGGTLSVLTMYVGHSAGSNGTYRNNSAHGEVLGRLDVGRDGNATMIVENGGVLSSNLARIGNGSQSTGVATVTGSSSTWTNETELIIGEDGSGILTVSNGGQLISGTTWLAYNAPATGNVTVTGAGSKWINNGHAFVGVDGTAALTVSNGGSVSNVSGFVGSGSAGNGTVTITGVGSEWRNEASLYIGGDASLAGGSGVVNILEGGKVFAGVLKTWPSGSINLSSGELTSSSMDITTGSFTMTGGRLASQTVLGGLTNTAGSLAPFGDSTGYAVVSSSYTQQTDATLEIGLGGTTTGGFDQLGIGGITTLGGELALSLLSDFVPLANDTFNILASSGGVAGTFANVLNGGRLATIDGAGSFVVNYGPGSTHPENLVVLSDFAHFGDYDRNGIVGPGDFAMWRSTYGSLNDLRADGNFDGKVDAADYIVWRKWRALTTQAAGAATLSTVPEPSTLVFLLWAFVVVSLHRPRAIDRREA